jgi:hypothetical protein
VDAAREERTVMAMLAMAVPILPGQTERWRRFVGELAGARGDAYRASRQRLGLRERVFFQTTPHGDLVTLVLEGDDPAAAFAAFGAGDDAFTQWFVQEVQAVHGVDLRQPPPGPLPELVVDSHADAR